MTGDKNDVGINKGAKIMKKEFDNRHRISILYYVGTKIN